LPANSPGRHSAGTCPEPLLNDVGLPSQKLPKPAATTTTDIRTQPVRSDDSRRAVLLRSNGRCENLCAGQPDDVTDSGDPILEVGHIDDRAGWGRDHPEQMIALCPNYHATKTRGRSRETLRASSAPKPSLATTHGFRMLSAPNRLIGCASLLRQVPGSLLLPLGLTELSGMMLLHSMSVVI
jgi:hypothetical protein